MSSSSILVRAVVDSILATARRNVEQDGALQPVLFVHQDDGAHLMAPLELPSAPEEKAAYFAGIGASFRHKGRRIVEALFLAEGWFVDAQSAPAALSVAPSRHPCRQEAIVVIGRNAGNTRASHVVQPFTRDAAHAPVWQPQPIAVYNQPTASGMQMQGVLDYVFVGEKGGEASCHKSNGSPPRRT